MKRKRLIILCIVLAVIIISIILFFTLRIKIDKSVAYEIAYKYIGVSESNISYKKIEKDIMDNCYEIELNDGTYKYELEIDMKTGKVINFEKDPISNINNNQNDNYNNTNITLEEVKQIVLTHANLNESDVIFTKTKQDYENGILVYEIEFIYNNFEYDYEINANTKEIIKYEKERR